MRLHPTLQAGETGGERLLGDVSVTSEYHAPSSGYLSTDDAHERRSTEGDRGNARGDVEGCVVQDVYDTPRDIRARWGSFFSCFGPAPRRAERQG